MTIRNSELIRRFKVGEVYPVYIRTHEGYAGCEAEMLPRLHVSFYDDRLEDPPIRAVASVEDAIHLVRERYESVHFRNGISSNDIICNPIGADENDYIIGFEFFPDVVAEVYSEMQSPNSLADFTVGVIKWFVKLRPLTKYEDQKL